MHNAVTCISDLRDLFFPLRRGNLREMRSKAKERAEAGELVEKGANLLVRVVLHRARQSHPEHATERYAKELQQVPGQVFHVVLPMPLW